MSDPLDILRRDSERVAPDPGFASRLRASLARALGETGVDMTSLEQPVRVVTEPRPAAVPYIAVRGAFEAIDWYRDVLGAELHGEPILMPDGRVGHCELGLAGGVLFLSEEHPELGVVAPTPGAAAVSLMLAVDDTDAVVARVTHGGGTLERPVYEDYGSRNAWVRDPFGHRWGLIGPVLRPEVRPEPIRHGDVGYLMLRTPDAATAEAFYSAVLGWEVAPGRGDQARTVTSTSVPMGIYGGADYTGIWCCYAVDSIEDALEVVRTHGGTAGPVRDEPYGRIADCVDAQGLEFSVYLAGSGERPALTGVRAGDLCYLTYEFADRDRGVAFYDALLRAPEPDRSPMAGTAGAGGENVVVPMWRVDDIDAAVARAQAAGGTAGPVERTPYGLVCACTDDQGGRFWLGQL